MVITRKSRFLGYAIFEVRKRYRYNFYDYFTDLFKIIIYLSKNLFLFTLNTSYVNNGYKINASKNASQKLHFPSRGSFIIIELQIARNICWCVNIHGQISLSGRVSRWAMKFHYDILTSILRRTQVQCKYQMP